MDMNHSNFKKILILMAFAIVLYVCLQNTDMVISVFRYLIGLIAPFLLGGCIAFALNVPMRFFEQKLFDKIKHRKIRKMKRTLSVVLALTVVAGVIVIILFMVLPELYNSFTAIGTQITAFCIRVPAILDQIAAAAPMLEEEIESFKGSFQDVDWKATGEMLMQFVQDKRLLSNTLNIASSVASSVANFAVGLVFSVYILSQKEKLGRQFRRLFYSFFPEKQVDRFLDVCSLTAASFGNFLSGQCVEALILGLMFFVSMSVLKLPYALVVSVLIAAMSLIPIFGAFIGCIVGTLLILIISPLKALWFLALFLVLQQVEGNLIYPRVVGGSVGLPSIWVLAAVTLGASTGGVLGMLFAIPVASVIYTLLREAVNNRIQERCIPSEKIG